MFLRSECDSLESEIDCDDDGVGLNSRIPDPGFGEDPDATIRMEPGTYFLYLDGFAGREGTGTVQISIQPLGN